MTTILIDTILLQYARAARAVAETHDGTVDTEIGLALILEFVVVSLAGDVLSRIGQGGERERLVDGLNAEFLSLLCP